MPEVHSGGNGGGHRDASVFMLLPAGSTTVKLGHTGVVYNVRPVVAVADALGVVLCCLPPPTTSVEIQMTETVIGGFVTMVVNLGSRIMSFAF